MIPFVFLYTFTWPVHASHSLFSESLIRKDQLQNVLEHEPANHKTACQNSVVRTSSNPFAPSKLRYALAAHRPNRDDTMQL